jgi:hypothetical protein
MKRSLLWIAFAAAPLAADEVYLKGGGRVSGVIVEQTAEKITVDIGAGNMSFQMSTVVKVEKIKSPLQEYRERADALGGEDVDGWRELARWAENEALGTQAREAWSEVARLAPGDAEANRSLGLVEFEGRWVTEEESYTARGFVEFEHEWMTPDERQAILAERAAREASEQAAIDEQIAADQQARADREAQEQAEHDAYWNSLPQYGDPLYYGYGGYPVYWPGTVTVAPGRGDRNRATQLPARGRGR